MYGRQFGFGMMQGNEYFGHAPFFGTNWLLWAVALAALGLAIAGFVIALRSRALARSAMLAVRGRIGPESDGGPDGLEPAGERE